MLMGKMAWRNLWRNRRRTLLTLSAIVFGIFLAVLFTGTQDKSFADMIDLSARLGGGHVVVQHDEYIDTPTLTRTVEGTDAIRSAAISDPRVHKAVDRITGHAMASSATNNVGVMFIAYDPTAEDDDTLSFLKGVQAGELLANPDDKGLVVGKRLAESLDVEIGKRVVFTMVDRNGQIVTGMHRVSGVIATGAPSIDGSLMLLPINPVRDLLGYAPDEATQVAVFVDDGRVSTEVAHSLAPQTGKAATLTWDQVQPELAGFIAMKVGGAIFMELVILVLVAASIFNTLFVSVMERMREFGIMRAIGHSPLQIFMLVMWESLWLAILGLLGAVGVTAFPYYWLANNGIDISAQMGDQDVEVAGIGMSSTLPFGVFPENLLIIACMAVAATLLSGLYPAWKAGRVVPVDAIKLV